MRLTILTLAGQLVLTVAGAAYACAQGTQADTAQPWRFAGLPTGEYALQIDTAIRHAGRGSVRIEGFASAPMGSGGILQQVRADHFRGQRVRLSAYMRTHDVRGAGGSIGLAAPANGVVLTQASTDEKGVHGTSDWQRVSIEIDVPDAAVGLNISARLTGRGSLWVDDVALEIVGPASSTRAPPALPQSASAQAMALSDHFRQQPAAPRALDFENVELAPAPPRSPLEPPGPLSPRGLDNLLAFARIVGVVRHFYPAEAVRIANWDDFTTRAVRRLESAPTPDSLARMLRALFAEVAPDITVETGGTLSAHATFKASTNAVAYWENRGIALNPPSPGRPSIYQSALTVAPAPNGQLPDGAPHPDSAWFEALPGGVIARVPIARWVELRADTITRSMVQPAPSAEPASPSDRATRLAGVINAWNVFQHSYPYFDVVTVDWPSELRRALATAATDVSPAEYQATLRRMVAAAQDGHGNVNAMIAGPRHAFLPVALAWVEEKLVVTQVAAGTNSVRRGDVIEAIHGVAAAELIAQREQLISSATPQWRRFRAVDGLLADTVDKAVTLLARSPEGAAREVRLTYTSPRVTDSLPEKVAELQPGMMYVDLDRISNADYVAALPKLQQARGIVFDLRGYPRNVSTPMILPRLAADTIRSARFEVPTFTRPDRHAVRWFDGAWVLPPIQPKFTAKIAFITGGGAISYAESTMGIVEHYRLGEIVGEATAGTNGNVNFFPVAGGFQVIFTGMRVRKQDGTQHHAVGIKPTIPVSRTRQGVIGGRDEALERAVALVAEGR